MGDMARCRLRVSTRTSAIAIIEAVIPAGIEPATSSFAGTRAIPLRYGTSCGLTCIPLHRQGGSGASCFSAVHCLQEDARAGRSLARLLGEAFTDCEGATPRHIRWLKSATPRPPPLPFANGGKRAR